MPVMEGKAVLFKELAGVDAYPICLDTKDPDEIVAIVKAISPGFGGVQPGGHLRPPLLLRRAAPQGRAGHPPSSTTTSTVPPSWCWRASSNAVKITGKKMEDLKVVVNGVGASGIACAKILMTAGCFNIIGCDTQGIVYRGRDNRGNTAKDEFAEISNPDNIEGDLAKAMQGADVFLGLSGPNTVTPAMVKDMNDEPIVFAMANPDPEIWPEEAQGLARVHGHRPLRLPQPDQQRPLLPRHLPRRSGTSAPARSTRR